MGGSLNDFQGVVARQGFAFDAAALVRGCRLSGLRFTQVLASQAAFQPYHWLTADSPSMDLGEGFDAYCRCRREAGSTLIARTLYKRRLAIRDLGPLRFESNAQDPCVLESLIAWKSRQYERIRAANIFTRPGILDFLRRLALGTLRRNVQQSAGCRIADDFKGVLLRHVFRRPAGGRPSGHALPQRLAPLVSHL